jgi:uncharacterized protein
MVGLTFEFDPAKSHVNRVKHGIDVIEAQALWHDDGLVLVQARTSDELRFLAIARVDGIHWTAVVTPRQGAIRLISVRRSRPSEVAIYEGS